MTTKQNQPEHRKAPDTNKQTQNQSKDKGTSKDGLHPQTDQAKKDQGRDTSPGTPGNPSKR